MEEITGLNIQGLELFAWVGEDELGSGEVGLKQGLVPAGLIPLVAIKKEKLTRSYIRNQLRVQAKRYGKRIYLVKFSATEVVDSTPSEDVR
jgi:hypothetical protein